MAPPRRVFAALTASALLMLLSLTVLASNAPANHPTLVDLIETSGHTWNAIAEGSGSGCSINPDRGEDHFPFLSYTTITGNPARCANLHSGSSADVVAALNAGTNFIWFTPTDQ